MTTQTIDTDKPHAEFVGYQQDDRIGGVRAWYIIKWPGHARHLSTVFTPTLIELGIEVPNPPPYIPKTQFKQVWIHRCENKSCHISYISTKPLVEHIRDTKHTEAVSELVNTTDVPAVDEPVAKQPQKAIIISEVPEPVSNVALIEKEVQRKLDAGQPQEQIIEDTIPDDPQIEDSYKHDPFNPPTEKKKSKKLVLIPGGWEDKEEEDREIIKFNAEKVLKDVIPEKVEEKKEVKPESIPEIERKVFVPATDEEIQKEVDAEVLDFRKKIHAEFPEIYGRKS